MPDGWSASELASDLRRFAGSQPNAKFRCISHDRLMAASHRLLSATALGGQPVDEHVASRILGNPHEYRRWEDEHARLMWRIAAERLPRIQRATLLETSVALIHRKALFEYLRDQHIRGDARAALIERFYPQRDYTRAVVGEHGHYIRSAASYLCANYLGRHLMFDTFFDQPLREYEGRYAQYFRAACELAIVSSDDPRRRVLQALLPIMKVHLSEWRRALLARALSQSDIWRRPQS